MGKKKKEKKEEAGFQSFWGFRLVELDYICFVFFCFIFFFRLKIKQTKKHNAAIKPWPHCNIISWGKVH